MKLTVSVARSTRKVAAGVTGVPSFTALAPVGENSTLLQPPTRKRRCQRMPAGRAAFCSGITVAPPSRPGSSMNTVNVTWSKPLAGFQTLVILFVVTSMRSAPPALATRTRRRSIWRFWPQPLSVG